MANSQIPGSATDSKAHRAQRPGKYLPLGLVAALCLIHFGANVSWRQTNVTMLGWDRAAHLVRSVEYFDAIVPFSVRDLLTSLMSEAFYPPLFHVSMAVAYAVFGVSADVGALTNTAYLIVLLFSVYGIGCQLYDRKTGLLATCLLSFFPIVFLMERFTYTEFSLLALVALSVFLGLKTDGFRQRRWAYALGVALGLGLLVKWVFIVFAGPPLFHMVLGTIARSKPKEIFGSFRPDGKRMLLSAGIGLAGAGVFYGFGGDWTLSTPFDSIIALCYLILLGALTYLTLSPRQPINHLLGTIAITLIVSILWYIPNLSFLSTALYKAFYWGSSKETALQIGSHFPVGRLFQGAVNEHLSVPLAFATIVLCLLWLVRRRHSLWPLKADFYILGMWLCIPFLFFASFSNPSAWNMRLSIGLVLPISIILARACLSLPGAWARRGVAIFLIAVAVVQWVVLSFDAIAYIPERTRIVVPGWGEVNWFAQGEFVQWPASKLTSRDYWLLPSIFRTIQADNRGGQQKDTVTLGLLVNEPYLNDYQAIFLSETEYPQIDVIGLFRDRKGLPVYSQMFGLDYLLVNDRASGGEDATDQSTMVATAILQGRAKDFEEAFREVATFHLPNDDVIHLYRNNSRELPRFIPPELMPRSIENPLNITFNDRLLLVGYTINQSPDSGRFLLELYWVALDEMGEDYSMAMKVINATDQVWGQQEGRPSWGSYPTLNWAKGEAVKDIREILVLPGTPPGEYMIELVVYEIKEGIWVNADQGTDVLMGPTTVLGANLSPDQLQIEHLSGAVFDERIRLLGYNIESGFRPGDNVHLTLFWQALQSMDVSYTVFCQLIGPVGEIWGQKDNPPVTGNYPTHIWTEGEVIRDQYDLSISSEALPGDCFLHIGLYVPETGERLPVIDPGGGSPGDHFAITGLRIEP